MAKMRRQEMESVIYGGGLDLVTPPLQVAPGKILNVKNYECDVSNGYRVIAGYERVDGRASPVRSPWTAILVVDTTGFVVAEVVTGGTSGATGTIIAITTSGLYLASVTGIFVDAEVLTSASQTDTTASEPFENITLDDELTFNAVRYLKELHYRDLILKVPGSGPIRGVHRHLDKVYAFRDNVGATECLMYEATVAGWVQKTFGHIFFFDTTTNKVEPKIPRLVNDGNGNEATIVGGAYKDSAEEEGYGVLTGFTVGFNVGDSLKEGTTTLARIAEAPIPIVLAPGGRYEFISYNFDGLDATYHMYGCSSAHFAFEFDTTLENLIPIYTDQDNRSIDTPSFIAEYKNHLFLGFTRGIVRNSEPGDQFLWDAAAGSLETGVGAAMTGFDATPKSLVVTTVRTTYVLTGNTVSTFQLDVASATTGAKAYTVQHLGTTFMLDDRGIIELSRVQAFGNFENATVSRTIEPLVKLLRQNIVGSTVSRSKNIYRLITSNGRGISMTLQAEGIISFSEFDLNVGVTFITNNEDELGEERIYFGSDDGFVYEMDAGQSFDGEAKEAWLQPVSHFFGTPTVLKRFFRMYVETAIEGSAVLDIYAEFALGTPNKQPTLTQESTFRGFKSAWDVGKWDEAIFDARSSSDATVELTGSGDAITTIFYSNSATDDPVTIKDVVYHYKARRALRGAR